MAGCSRLAFVKPEPASASARRRAVARTPRRRQRRGRATRCGRAQHARAGGTATCARAMTPTPRALRARRCKCRPDFRRRQHPAGRDRTSAAAGARRPGAVLQARRRARARATARMLNNYGAWLCAQRHAPPSRWLVRPRAARRRAMRRPRLRWPTPAAARCDAGQPGRAERDLRQALALDPANPVALAALARLQYRPGRLFRSARVLRAPTGCCPRDAAALQLASQIEERLGDSAAAARYVQRLRAEFPGTAQDLAGEAKSP